MIAGMNVRMFAAIARRSSGYSSTMAEEHRMRLNMVYRMAGMVGAIALDSVVRAEDLAAESPI